MNTESFGSRLAHAIDVAGSSYSDIATALAVTRSAVGHWATERREPDRATLEKIAALLHVRVSWLAFGDGPMTDDAAGDASSPAPSDATVTVPDGTPTLERRTRTRATKTASGKGSAAV